MSQDIDLQSAFVRNKISEILRNSDTRSVSAKDVRTQLQSQLNVNLDNHRKEVERITLEILASLQSNDNSDSSVSDIETTTPHRSQSTKRASTTTGSIPNKKSKTNGHSSELAENDDESSSCSSIEVDAPNGKSLTDEDLAKKLYKEELAATRTRRSNATYTVKPEKKKRPRQDPNKPKKYRPCVMSPELASYLKIDVERDPIPGRPEVVKIFWDIAKSNNMLDPKDRKYVICDDDWQKLFKVKRFRMFSIMKFLVKHMKWADEIN